MGLAKDVEGKGSQSRERQLFRQDVLTRHAGRFVVLDAPVLGRRAKSRNQRPWLARKLLPADAPWTRFILPPAMYMHDHYNHYRIGLGGLSDTAGLALAPYCRGRWQLVAKRLGLQEVRPYRTEGLEKLAATQCWDDEIGSGAVWEPLLGALEQAKPTSIAA